MADSPKRDFLAELEESQRVREWEKDLPFLDESEARKLVAKFMSRVESAVLWTLIMQNGGKVELNFDDFKTGIDPNLRLFSQFDDSGLATMSIGTDAEIVPMWVNSLAENQWAGRDPKQLWSVSEVTLRKILGLPDKNKGNEMTEQNPNDTDTGTDTGTSDGGGSDAAKQEPTEQESPETTEGTSEPTTTEEGGEG